MMILMASLETVITVCVFLVPLVLIVLCLRPVFKRFEAIEREVDKELGLKNCYGSVEEMKKELDRLRRLDIEEKDLSLPKDEEDDLKDFDNLDNLDEEIKKWRNMS